MNDSGILKNNLQFVDEYIVFDRNVFWFAIKLQSSRIQIFENSFLEVTNKWKRFFLISFLAEIDSLLNGRSY